VSDDIVPRTKTSSAENDDLDSTEETAMTKTIRDRMKNMMERRQMIDTRLCNRILVLEDDVMGDRRCIP